jgi:cytochrome c-type biogenesis protein CcmH/NrfF
MKVRGNFECVMAIVVVTACLASGAGLRAQQGPPQTTAQQIEGGLTCQCPCNQTVSACNHEGCASKAEMQAMADKEVASGKDGATILQDFVLKYGTQVLATPPPNGFNLMVWILPILGGIVGLSAVVMAVRRWRHVPAASAAAAAISAPIEPEAMAEMEEEMKRLG